MDLRRTLSYLSFDRLAIMGTNNVVFIRLRTSETIAAHLYHCRDRSCNRMVAIQPIRMRMLPQDPQDIGRQTIRP